MTQRSDYTLKSKYLVCSKCMLIYDRADNPSGCPVCLKETLLDSAKIDTLNGIAELAMTGVSGDEFHSRVVEALNSYCDYDIDLPDSGTRELCPYCEASMKPMDQVRCDSCQGLYLEEQGLTADCQDGPCNDCPDVDRTNCGAHCNTSQEIPENESWKETITKGISQEYYETSRGDSKPSGASLSRDDQNRRLRESRLGYAPPSDDWADAGTPVVCIHADQELNLRGLKALRALGMHKALHYIQGVKIPTALKEFVQYRRDNSL